MSHVLTAAHRHKSANGGAAGVSFGEDQRQFLEDSLNGWRITACSASKAL